MIHLDYIEVHRKIKFSKKYSLPVLYRTQFTLAYLNGCIAKSSYRRTSDLDFRYWSFSISLRFIPICLHTRWNWSFIGWYLVHLQYADRLDLSINAWKWFWLFGSSWSFISFGQKYFHSTKIKTFDCVLLWLIVPVEYSSWISNKKNEFEIQILFFR